MSTITVNLTIDDPATCPDEPVAHSFTLNLPPGFPLRYEDPILGVTTAAATIRRHAQTILLAHWANAIADTDFDAITQNGDCE